MSFDNNAFDNISPWDGTKSWDGMIDGWDQKNITTAILCDLKATFNIANQAFSNGQVLNTPAQGVESGSLTVVDTSTGTVKVVSNKLELVGNGASSASTGAVAGAVTKALGKALFVTQGAGGFLMGRIGFDDSTALDVTPDPWYLRRNNSIYYWDSTTVILAAITNTTTYKLLFLLGGYDVNGVPFKTGDTVADFLYGVRLLIQEDTDFPTWTLLWTASNDATATLYPQFNQHTAVVKQTIDNILIPTNVLNVNTMFQPNFLDTFTGTNGDSLVTVHEPDVVAGVSSPGVTAWQSGADTWDIQTNKARNTPGLDADIAPNNTCTTDVARTEANATTGWTNDGMATFESVTVGDEPNGSYSLHLVANSAGDLAYATVTTVVGLPYKVSVIFKKNAATDSTRIRFGAAAGSASTGTITLSSAAWATSTLIFVAGTTTTYISVRENGVNDNAEVWIDVLKVEPITLNEMMASDDMGITEGIFDIDGTIDSVFTGQVGIVTHLDDKDTPANCVIAYYNRTNAVVSAELFKLVAGVGTSLINTAAIYAAGAKLRVIAYRSGANLKIRLYYNGALIGTEQTISDAGIVDNTRHGIISTHTSNSVDNFSVMKRTDAGWDAEISRATGGVY